MVIIADRRPSLRQTDDYRVERYSNRRVLLIYGEQRLSRRVCTWRYVASRPVKCGRRIRGSPYGIRSNKDVSTRSLGQRQDTKDESYEGVAPMDDEGWYDTQGGDVDAYSSLIGISVAGINEPTFIDYSTRIQSPYLSLDCSLNTKVTERMSIEDTRLPGESSNASSSGAIIFWDVPVLSMNSSRRIKRHQRLRRR